jgi:glutaredoxin
VEIKLISAVWCSGCKQLKEMFDSRGIKYEVIDFDTDEGFKLASELNVRSLPTAVVNGEVATGVLDILRLVKVQ